MKLFGLIMAAGGALLGLIALLMRTAVHNDATYSYGNYIPSSDTINIGLLQNQHLTFLAGCFLFLAGVVVACTGIAIEAVQNATRSSAPVEAVSQDAAEPYQLLARRGAMTEAEQEAANKTDRTIIIGAIVLAVAALIAVLGFGVGTSPPAQDAMITNNASAMADAMEQEADNLEAIAGAKK